MWGKVQIIGCKERFSSPDREKIFHSFWSLSDITRQRDFLLKYTEVTDKTITKTKGKSRRSQTVKCFFPSNQETNISRVCKTFFLDTLDISDQMLYTAIKKQNLGMSSGDCRGKHKTRPKKVSQVQLDFIKSHIESFPTVESHYCRKDTNRSYLLPELNVCKNVQTL